MTTNRVYRAYNRADTLMDRGLVQAVITTPLIVAVFAAALVDDLPRRDESWWAWAAKQWGLFMLALMPVIRDIGSAAQGFAPKTPTGSFSDAIVRVPQEMQAYFSGKESLTKYVSDTGKAVSTVVPLPGAGEISRMMDYWDSYEQGKEGEFSFYQMITKGPTRKK